MASLRASTSFIRTTYHHTRVGRLRACRHPALITAVHCGAAEFEMRVVTRTQARVIVSEHSTPSISLYSRLSSCPVAAHASSAPVIIPPSPVPRPNEGERGQCSNLSEHRWTEIIMAKKPDGARTTAYSTLLEYTGRVRAQHLPKLTAPLKPRATV